MCSKDEPLFPLEDEITNNADDKGSNATSVSRTGADYDKVDDNDDDEKYDDDHGDHLGPPPNKQAKITPLAKYHYHWHYSKSTKKNITSLLVHATMAAAPTANPLSQSLSFSMVLGLALSVDVTTRHI